MTAIGAAMAAEWLFVRLIHAMFIDTHGVVLTQRQSLVAAGHHGVTVVAIVLGAVIGMVASFFGSLFPTPRSTFFHLALLPVPRVAGIALGLPLGEHRVLTLGSLVAVLAQGAYCRRFGPSGFFGGNVLFLGDFFGFLLHQQLRIEDLGWLTAEIAIGTAVAVLARFTKFYASRRAELRRMLRPFSVRAREVSARALDLFDRPPAQAPELRGLHRRPGRLTEAALDASLGKESAIPRGGRPANCITGCSTPS